MRLYVDVNWDGEMSKSVYPYLLEAIADEVMPVAGQFGGHGWEVSTVGIMPPRVIRRKGETDE